MEQKIISKWFEEMSYGYHDVKLFLGTQVYDAGHKVEAFRKRALANGGGLGRSPLGQLYRGWYGGLKWTEVVIALDVVYKSYELTMFEAGQDFARTDVESKMYELMARDSRPVPPGRGMGQHIDGRVADPRQVALRLILLQPQRRSVVRS